MTGVAASQEPPPAPPEIGEEEQQETTPQNGEAQANQPIPEPPPVPINQARPPPGQEPPADDGQDGEGISSTDWWLIGFTGLLTLFTGALASISYFQWSATRKAADAAQKSADTLIKGERPYVFVARVEAQLDEDTKPPVLLYFRNAGRTPAVGVCAGVGFRLFDGDNQPSTDDFESLIRQGTFTIAADHEVCLPFGDVRKWTAQDMADLRKDRKTFWVYGWIEHTNTITETIERKLFSANYINWKQEPKPDEVPQFWIFNDIRTSG